MNEKKGPVWRRKVGGGEELPCLPCWLLKTDEEIRHYGKQCSIFVLIGRFTFIYFFEVFCFYSLRYVSIIFDSWNGSRSPRSPLNL